MALSRTPTYISRGEFVDGASRLLDETLTSSTGRAFYLIFLTALCDVR